MANPSKFKAVVNKIISYGDGVYSVDFSLEKGIAKFKPGQFLHLTLDEFDPSSGFWPESRVFSIASVPGVSHVQIIYSVKGAYTKKMSHELSEGKEVWLKLPYGDFIIEKHIQNAEKIFMIAGGTGVSPFIPFLKNYSSEKYSVPIALYYGIRNESFYLYREVIEALKERIDVRVISGMMDIKTISGEIVSSKGARCFISGPPVMINSFKQTLLSMAFKPENIVIDEWE